MTIRMALASGSPRRRELLRSLCWAFDIVTPDVDESRAEGEAPSAMALRLARAKAVSASNKTNGALTIGADTVVDMDGVPFGKPGDRDDALRMLRTLNGRTHVVHTGVAVARSGSLLDECLESTAVTFGNLSEREMADFAASGEGDDKAGAYAIQGRGALLVERIEGCYYNVVGLPLYRLNDMLKNLGDDF